MLKIKEIISQKVAEQLLVINPEAEISVGDIASMLEYPPDASMGDLALPCVSPTNDVKGNDLFIHTKNILIPSDCQGS